jgi:hypothetical protein
VKKCKSSSVSGSFRRFQEFLVKGAGSAKFNFQRIDIFYVDSVSKCLTV